MNNNQKKAKSLCPVCSTEYIESDENRCSVCNWDLTPCPPDFRESYKSQLSWAKETWFKLQFHENQIHNFQAKLQTIKQEREKFEGEILYRLEKIEQMQDNPQSLIWLQPQNSGDLDITNINQHLKKVNQEQQKLTSEVKLLSIEVENLKLKLDNKNHSTFSIISKIGIDYTPLHNFLVAGELEKADRETNVILCKLLFLNPKRIYDKDFDVINILANPSTIPCEDLQIIDSLWLKYSHGCFGLSVQKKRYQAMFDDEHFNYDKYVQDSYYFIQFFESLGWYERNDNGALYSCSYYSTSNEKNLNSFYIYKEIGYFPTPMWLGKFVSATSPSINYLELLQRLEWCNYNDECS